VQVEAAFAAALAVFQPAGRFAVAVSGGPDSLALMHLAAAHVPLVLTVDHGLRAQSAAEAAKVAAWAAALGLSHRTLVWRGEKPAKGIQAAARTARYCLLAEACLAEGLTGFMTGHTLDDQIETVAMRRAHGSGGIGAAGIPAQAEVPDAPVRLMRPLIGLTKAALVSWLSARGQDYFSDPSNADPRFERARLRASGATADAAEVTAHQRARAAAERSALEALADAEVSERLVLADRTRLRALDDAGLDAALGALLRLSGGRDYPGTRGERDRLAAAIRAETPISGRTLAGAMVRSARRAEGPAGHLAFLPEHGGAISRRRFWLPFGQFPQIAADGTLV
jgi:tRNA(Ile)-lysidine synthase